MDRPLSDIISVKSRYARSVSLSRDWNREESLDGYILTPSGRGILRRISSTLNQPASPRAWSITGPYGSGKSAFALFAAQLLCGEAAARRRASAILKTQEAEIHRSLFTGRGTMSGGKRFLPVLVVGSREPLHLSLLRALDASISGLSKVGPFRAIKKHIAVLSETRKGPSIADVVALLESVTAVVRTHDNFSGVLVIVDELGKSLEFAATTPEADIFLLQSIAEFAAGSQVPFVVLTILHQSVERYADQLTAARRNEWAKVHGRFEDVAFDESLDQILRLIASAIERDGSSASRSLEKSAERNAVNAWTLGARCGTLEKGEFVRMLTASSPLQPITALILGPLFRRLAQNERSLFAFLTSGEPYGFQDFIRNARVRSGVTPLLTLDRVYDYVTCALGSTLFTQHRGKQWAEVESTLERLVDASATEVRVAKSIGLLQAIGYSAGLSASRGLLQLALASDQDTPNDIDAAITSLEKKAIVVYRRHADGYALWEGSDVDLDAHVAIARRKLDASRRLAAYLTDLASLQPVVARRHSFCTGTLRYFDALYADVTNLSEVASRDLAGADGRIIYCVPTSAEENKHIEELVTKGPIAQSPEVLVAIPSGLAELNEACAELWSLTWVRDNTPELASDATARRELRARLAGAEEMVSRQVAYSFATTESSRCRWYYRGKPLAFKNDRALHAEISRICDELYSLTPVWKNELANRRSLSTSAAKARRNLIEGMLERADQEHLGIQGMPPERSMYDSLLRASGLHRFRKGKWSFAPPARNKDQGLTAVWNAVNEFLEQSEGKKRPVAELFDTLQRPPFGLKQGVLPILFAAVMVVHDADVALYESGSFVPLLTTAVFERILRSPKDFEIQQCSIIGPRAAVFAEYASVVAAKPKEGQAGKERMLGIVRQLFRFVKQLPEYVRNTQQLSDEAKEILRAIKETREPDQLLFRDLPAACGAKPFGTKGRTRQDDVEQFFRTFRSAMAELQQAYPKLQSAVEDILASAFGLGRPLATMRRELAHRCKVISELAVDSKLKAFIVRAMDTMLDDAGWLESVAGLFGERSMETWSDHDRAKFEVNVAVIARRFRHFEALAFDLERTGTAILDGDVTALRIAVTTSTSEEIERVVRIPVQMRSQVDQAQNKIRQILTDAELIGNSDLSVAILADFSRQLLVEAI